VGQDQYQQPATVSYAEQYKTGHGYPAEVIAVADPGWMKIAQAINHGSGTIPLPLFAVLDGTMTLIYFGPSAGQVVNTLAQLTGKAYQASSGCAGFCNGKAAAGCYCDNECAKYGDCCADVCDACGYCN
jgi:hypothetical protein